MLKKFQAGGMFGSAENGFLVKRESIIATNAVIISEHDVNIIKIRNKCETCSVFH